MAHAHRGDPDAGRIVPEGESETLLIPPDAPAGERRDGRREPAHTYAPTGGARPSLSGPYSPSAPPRAPERRPHWVARVSRSRKAPILRLGLYYAALIAAMGALIYWVPVVRDAFVSPVVLPTLEGGGLTAGPVISNEIGGKLSINEALQRAFTTLLVIAGALSLVIPVAWVYMFTKRFRYDPALVASVIILPIVVAGIALVVKNSLALAFSLAGIVAAVRFRNTLKDPRDAVYIFLVIGIGLSAGVQALDVALVMSLAFNMVVLFVWKYNVGSIYSGRYGQTGILSVGSSELLMAQEPQQQREIRRRVLAFDDDMRTDGILLVHSFDPDLARHTVQEALGDTASDWRLLDVVRRPDERPATLEYLVRLKGSATPAELVGALDERWSSQVAAAEYVPFRTRRKKRGKKND